MEIEIHQLDRRYQGLRKHDPQRESRLLASVSQHGQQVPVVVVGGQILIDGFKRVRVLTTLGQDTVQSVCWPLEEQSALMHFHLMGRNKDSALEHGWFLSELKHRFGMSATEMARRLDKSESFVSRHLALVSLLPQEVQEHVRTGALCAHAAMKYLVPLARANREDCVDFAATLSRHRLSTRQVGNIYRAWMAGDDAEKTLLLKDPLLFLRVLSEGKGPSPEPLSAAEVLVSELSALCGLANRCHRHVQGGAAKELLPSVETEVRRMLLAAKGSAERLFSRCDKELSHARSSDALGDSSAA